MAGKNWAGTGVTREEQQEVKRQAVLRAGAKWFCSKGFSLTSIDDIAEELNVTKRTVYYYFDSKDDILFNCLMKGLAFSHEVVEATSDSSLPPLERITVLIEKYLEWVSTDLGACLLLVRDFSLTEERNREIRKGKAVLEHHLRGLIQLGIADGTIRECDTRLATASVFGALNWVPFWNRKTPRVPTDKIVCQFRDMALLGLRA